MVGHCQGMLSFIPAPFRAKSHKQEPTHPRLSACFGLLMWVQGSRLMQRVSDPSHPCSAFLLRPMLGAWLVTHGLTHGVSPRVGTSRYLRASTSSSASLLHCRVQAFRKSILKSRCVIVWCGVCMCVWCACIVCRVCVVCGMCVWRVRYVWQ